MTPTIDDIEAALPHVPAGLHCGDLTEPDERRAFAVTVHEIVVRASQTVPGSPESDEQGSSGTQVQGNQDGRNNGVSSCVGYPPDIEWGVDEARVTWAAPTTPPLMTIGEASVSALYCTADERCRKIAHTKVLEEAGRWKGKAVCVDHDPRENAR